MNKIQTVEINVVNGYASVEALPRGVAVVIRDYDSRPVAGGCVITEYRWSAKGLKLTVREQKRGGDGICAG